LNTFFPRKISITKRFADLLNKDEKLYIPKYGTFQSECEHFAMCLRQNNCNVQQN
jgi:hypothetical protein